MPKHPAGKADSPPLSIDDIQMLRVFFEHSLAHPREDISLSQWKETLLDAGLVPPSRGTLHKLVKHIESTSGEVFKPRRAGEGYCLRDDEASKQYAKTYCELARNMDYVRKQLSELQCKSLVIPEITIGMYTSMTTYLMPPVMATLIDEDLQLRLRMIVRGEHDFIQQILAGAMHLAIAHADHPDGHRVQLQQLAYGWKPMGVTFRPKVGNRLLFKELQKIMKAKRADPLALKKVISSHPVGVINDERRTLLLHDPITRALNQELSGSLLSDIRARSRQVILFASYRQGRAFVRSGQAIVAGPAPEVCVTRCGLEGAFFGHDAEHPSIPLAFIPAKHLGIEEHPVRCTFGLFSLPEPDRRCTKDTNEAIKKVSAVIADVCKGTAKHCEDLQYEGSGSDKRLVHRFV